MLQIHENYRIKTDRYNYILQNKRMKKETNEEYWENIGYFKDFESLVLGLINMELRRKIHFNNIEDMAALSDHIIQVANNITQIILQQKEKGEKE